MILNQTGVAFKKFIFIIAVFMINNLLAADTAVEINPAKFHTLLDKISLQLSVQVPNAKRLEDAIHQISSARDKAEQCVKNTTLALKQLGEITTISQDTAILKPNKSQPTLKPNSVISPEKYIETKKLTLEQQLASCQLAVIRSQEVIQALSAKAQELAASELFHRDSTSTNLIKSLKEFYKLPQIFHNHFNYHEFYNLSGIKLLFSLKNIVIIFFLVVLGYILGDKSRYNINKQLVSIGEREIESTPTLLRQALLVVLSRYIIPLTQSVLLVTYFSLLSAGTEITPLLIKIVYLLAFYCFYYVLTKFFFVPPYPAKSIIKLSHKDRSAIVRRLNIFGFLVMLGYIGYEITYSQILPDIVIQLPATLLLTMLTLTFISILWYANHAPNLKTKYYSIRVLISSILSLFILVSTISTWLGYKQFSMYLLTGLVLTTISIFITWIFFKLVSHLLKVLSGTEANWQKQIRNQMGLKKNAPIPELVTFKFVVYALMWGGLLLLVLKIWRLSSTSLQHLVDAIFSGFKFANIEIIPSRILFSLLFLPILFMITRWGRSALARSEEVLGANRGAREAVATILGYVGFTFSLFIALIIAGVNLTGLTFVFGALSLGIGFGLQNIVSNFVSGLILLIERPIKVGDRIIVSGLEGYVTKIRIRATQLRSLDLSDVIVPNSELISSKVTNLMFQDSMGKISIPVSVAYNSDIDLVKRLLEDTANSHPEVIPGNVNVYLKEFEDNGYLFILRVMVRDIDNKLSVSSDLNFAIVKSFEKNNIQIPFPQREVFVRNLPQEFSFKST